MPESEGIKELREALKEIDKALREASLLQHDNTQATARALKRTAKMAEEVRGLREDFLVLKTQLETKQSTEVKRDAKDGESFARILAVLGFLVALAAVVISLVK